MTKKEENNNTCYFFDYDVELVVLFQDVVVFVAAIDYSCFVNTVDDVVDIAADNNYVVVDVAAGDVVAIDHVDCVEIMFARCPIRDSTVAAAVAAAVDSYYRCHLHHPK